jgi:glycosyltransferase involved in cell wall biosynthesis
VIDVSRMRSQAIVLPRRRRILFVEENQDGTVGGSYYSLLTLVRSLDRTKYDPLVVFYETTSIIDKFAAVAGAPVIFKKSLGRTFERPCGEPKLVCLPARKIYSFVALVVIPFIKSLSFLIKNKIDLVELNNSAHSGGEWLLAAKLLRKKCIVHQRGWGQWSWLARKRAAYFDKIICISDAVRTHLARLKIGGNAVVIYNAIDADEFRRRIKLQIHEVKREFGVNINQSMVGIIGNFQEWKGQRTVIRAVDLLRRTYPDLICLLIGDVSKVSRADMLYFDDLRREIDQKDLRRNIIITGYRSDVPDLVNALDIQIHASTEPEPFGRVVLEGMCLGKPVIATNIGGPVEIIENGISGILVPPGDPERLAYQMEFLLKNPDTQTTMGRNASKRVTEVFGLDRFSFNTAKFYENLFGE